MSNAYEISKDIGGSYIVHELPYEKHPKTGAILKTYSVGREDGSELRSRG